MDKEELQRLTNLTGAMNALLESRIESQGTYVASAILDGKDFQKTLLNLAEKSFKGGTLTEKEVDSVFEGYGKFRDSVKVIEDTFVSGTSRIRFDTNQAKLAEIPTINNNGERVFTNLSKLGVADALPRSTAEFNDSDLTLTFLQQPPQGNYSHGERTAYKNLEKFLDENGKSGSAKEELKALMDDLKKGPMVEEAKLDKHIENISKKANVNVDLAKDRFQRGFEL